MTIFLELLFALLMGHAFADFALQSSEMGKGKNRNRKPENVPLGQKIVSVWPYWMTAHALIHGAFVWAITGIVWFGVAETILHWLIDFAKCENRTTPHEDQALHIFCKVAYAFIIVYIL